MMKVEWEPFEGDYHPCDLMAHGIPVPATWVRWTITPTASSLWRWPRYLCEEHAAEILEVTT